MFLLLYFYQNLHYQTLRIVNIMLNNGYVFVNSGKKELSKFDTNYAHQAPVLLDKFGIAVRTGHHCAQPIMDYYQIPGTIRASFSFYNTKEEIDRMIEALNKAVRMLQ